MLHPPKHPADRIALVVIVIHFALVLWWICTSFAVVDEVGHLGSGLATWQTGDTRPYCVNPPLPRMIATIPLWIADAKISSLTNGPPGFRSEWPLAKSLVLNNPDDYVYYTRLCRIVNLVWSVLLLYVLARWSFELYGPWGRLISLTLWCFEPTCIAYSGVVVPDVASAAAGLLASYVFWKYLREPSWTMAWFCGLALGLALLTKSTWLLLFAIWPTLMLIARLNAGTTTNNERPLFRHFLLIFPLGWLVLCAGFGFSKMGQPLGEFAFISKSLSGIPSGEPGITPEPDNRFRGTALERLPIPLPADMLVGVDVQKYDFERGLHSYLNGEWRARGWWYYYLYAMAIKLPIPTLLLVLAGLFWCLYSPRSPDRLDEWCFLLPAIATIAFVSSQTGFNHHMRYVLPAFPFLFLAAGRLACLKCRVGEGFAEPTSRSEEDGGLRKASTHPTGLRFVVGALLIWCGTATFSYAPYFMSYFNPLAGGPDNGWKHLVDSNIDWGQDLLHLQRWMSKHPEATPIGVQYYNLVDPQHVGMNVGKAPTQPTPGYFALDVNFVAGSRFRVGSRDGPLGVGPFAYFQHFTPIDKAGYSIFIYHITEEEANRVRAIMGLPPWFPAEGKP